jgi:UDP-N-acetylglucosamine/UDP-N-acetylgalactosamine diphosphorylase
MQRVPDALQQRLRDYGQEHALRWWDQLTAEERTTLVEQLNQVDLEEMRQLFERHADTYSLPPPEKLKPVPVIKAGDPDTAAVERGEEALRAGEVAVLLVAGGQGSRLGFDHPKGMYPIGPVTGNSLFQIHAEKVLALQRRYGRSVPLLIMTSHATDAETRRYFADHRYFGLPADDVLFFQQGEMPALDIRTGKLLMESRGRLFTGPNGHGGTLSALADSGLLHRLREREIRQVFYYQVDNPMVKVAAAEFLGRHLNANADVSSKVIAKESPTDRLGNFVLVDGQCSIIEYSDLPADVARQTDENGQLRIWAGNPAIHIFSTAFLTRVTNERTYLPFHVARKKVPFINEDGEQVQPETENALKFEMFIFDAFPLAERWVLLETTRPSEFVPLKNATGADSPELVRKAMSNQAAGWLENAGVKVPRTSAGDAAVPLEISPLFALNAAELARRVSKSLRITGPLYLGD